MPPRGNHAPRSTDTTGRLVLHCSECGRPVGSVVSAAVSSISTLIGGGRSLDQRARYAADMVAFKCTKCAPVHSPFSINDD